MNKSLKVSFKLGVFVVGCWRLDASGNVIDQAELPRLPVHLYNTSAAPRCTLERGTREAARILATAGVEIDWQQGSAEVAEAFTSDQSAVAFRIGHQPDSRDFLVVKIIPGLPDYSIADALGFALPDARFGPHIYVFYDRIDRLSRAFGADLGTVLGAAIAHEIGHVLIGLPIHYADGIMKERWSRTECRQTAKGYLGFTLPQSKLIRDGVERRLMLTSGANRTAVHK